MLVWIQALESRGIVTGGGRHAGRRRGRRRGLLAVTREKLDTLPPIFPRADLRVVQGAECSILVRRRPLRQCRAVSKTK